MIPKRIVQTYYSSELIPELYDKVMELQRFNPDYEYEFYDDNDCLAFITEHFRPIVVNAYNTILPGAYRADLFRYCKLYVDGGVYLDIKGRVLQSFDSMFDTLDYKADFMITDEVPAYASMGYYWNGFMMSAPRTQILFHAIRVAVRNILKRNYTGNCLGTTGTGVFAKFKHLGLMKPENHPFAIHPHGHNIVVKKTKRIVINLLSNEYRKEQQARNGVSLHYNRAWKEKKVFIDNVPFDGDLTEFDIT